MNFFGFHMNFLRFHFNFRELSIDFNRVSIAHPPTLKVLKVEHHRSICASIRARNSDQSSSGEIVWLLR